MSINRLDCAGKALEKGIIKIGSYLHSALSAESIRRSVVSHVVHVEVRFKFIPACKTLIDERQPFVILFYHPIFVQKSHTEAIIN